MRPSAPERLLDTAVLLAARDGQVSPEELVVLRGVAARLGLEKDAADQAVAAAAEDPSRVVTLPRDRGERVALLHDLCEVAAADGRVSAGERRFLEQVAARLEMPTGELLEALAPMVAKAREATAKSGRRGREQVKTLAIALTLFLMCLLVTGWFNWCDGVVVQQKRRTSQRNSYYSLLLDDGTETDVPHLVHDAAVPGARVTKWPGAVWWTVDGRALVGPSALGVAALTLAFVLSVVAGELLVTGNDEDRVGQIGTVAAGLSGFVQFYTWSFSASAAVLLVGFLAIVAVVVTSWPGRKARLRRRRARSAPA